MHLRGPRRDFLTSAVLVFPGHVTRSEGFSPGPPRATRDGTRTAKGLFNLLEKYSEQGCKWRLLTSERKKG